MCSYSRGLLRAGSLHWRSLWYEHFTLCSFLVMQLEGLAEKCLVSSSALTPSLPLSHRLGEFILSDYGADKGIPRTTMTERTGFTYSCLKISISLPSCHRIPAASTKGGSLGKSYLKRKKKTRREKEAEGDFPRFCCAVRHLRDLVLLK